MAKKYKVNISFNAQNDLEHIFFYIAQDSTNNAKNFILELEKKIYSLDTMPERFALTPENIFFGTNYRHITSLAISREDLEKRQRRKRYIPMSEEEKETFRKAALSELHEEE